MEIELPDEIEEIGTYEPSRAEVRKAIGHLKNGKAPGTDNIQAEPLKADIDYAKYYLSQGDHRHSAERREDTKKMEERIDCQTADRKEEI